MRKLVYISGAVSISLLPAGAVLKILHLPGSAVVLIAGAALFSLVFVPVAAVYLFRKRKAA